MKLKKILLPIFIVIAALTALLFMINPPLGDYTTSANRCNGGFETAEAQKVKLVIIKGETLYEVMDQDKAINNPAMGCTIPITYTMYIR